MDRDKFRPTVDLLRGKAFQPEDKHYELLSWMLGPERLVVEDEEGIIGPAKTPAIKKILFFVKAKKKEFFIASAAFVVLTAGIWLTYRSWQQCMYWNGSEYQVASCNIETPGHTLYAMDERKLSRFKKVLRPDTVTKASVGKLWYFKVNHRLELFTDSGMHPVWTNRRLKPLSHYMQSRYLTGDTSVSDNSKSAILTAH
ncbi:hypothetical protein INP83_10795 [Mucilaginibacter sp. 21P]|uniref:hypothetical protein n=1 Tax=Mucilaginibacter sp. 21P TaxID=2778902 RepID=UPI001C587DFB|nr:hypothetical protein [Mucilaginibacter sp. 21P]QXV67541.1 hypothetical protein INP83_10795 [Mucilaginibacter sp. 21P]